MQAALAPVGRTLVSFRVLAFLATVSAMATVAWLSRDATLLLVGAAGLLLGNLYMRRTNYAASRVRTGVLLVLMLILLVYLGQDMLFSFRNDPILLARYLVYGLIVSSFDLRSRRNVLGTVVLCAMLFMLLSQMAFWLWFPVLAGVFAMLALGAAVVAHVDGEAEEAVVGPGIAAGKAKVAALSVLGMAMLGAAIFVLMPKLSLGGVGQAAWLPSHIDLSLPMLAPLPAKPSAAAASGILPSRQDVGDPSGRYASLGYTGLLPEQEVTYVRSLIPSYWRGLVFTEYDRTGWRPSADFGQVEEERDGEVVFADARSGGPNATWYTQTYYLLSDQPHALFTGYTPDRAYLPTTGTTALPRGSVYRAISRLPRLTPQALRQDLVSSATLEGLPPAPTTDRVRSLAQEIVAGVSNDYDRAVRLEQFLLLNYSYDLLVEPLTSDAVDTFLFERQAGYCAQFATAMAVMARQVGLPARVAAGYLPGAYNTLTGAYAVRAADAHAWVEIRFIQHGWVAFDPTPRPDGPQSFSWAGGLVPLGFGGAGGAGASGLLFDLGIEKLLGAVTASGWGWLALALGLVALGAAVLLTATARRKREAVGPPGYTLLQGQTRAAVRGTYRRMTAVLARRGLPSRAPSQTPSEYASVAGER